jgi:small-conductance mechanosensitive channel
MNPYVQNTADVIRASFQNFYQIIINFLPNLIAAIIIFLVGWAIASALGTLVSRGLKYLRIDELGNRFGMNKTAERIGRHFTISGLLGWLVKWFFLVITFVAAANALGLSQVSQFLYGEAIPYFGNVVLAAIILTLGILIANFVHEVVRDSLLASRFSASEMVANISRWAILIFTFIAALAQLKIATFFMQYLFIAIVFMVALAGGLAFGLGGRDEAKGMLESLKKHQQV